MKTLFTTLIALGGIAFGSAASAVTISPDYIGGVQCNSQTSIITNEPIINCWDGTGTTDPSAFDVDEVAAATGYDLRLIDSDGDGEFDDPVAPLSLLYKADYDDGSEADTMFVDSYTTTFIGDPNGATIVNDDTEYTIDCPTCFLYVKDGSNDPIWYIFELAGWNGTDPLDLSGFWPENGAISHVAIFGSDTGDRGLIPPVPIPPSVWLFGTGLLGLVGVARRKNPAC